MPTWLIAVLSSAGSVVLTLTVTLIFNKLVALPGSVKKQKADEKAEKDQLKKDNKARDCSIAELKENVAKLQTADVDILAACAEIKDSMLENRSVLNDRLDRLEKREKNALRQKILTEYRLFTDEAMNPMQAWTEMEHHSFFELVHDYEDLGGNDYVHSEVLPAVNRLRVIPMSDRTTLYDLMSSRRLK